MKGLVFTELLRMADSVVGENKVDQVLDRCPLSSGGAYNAVGNYPCSELTLLAQEFSTETSTDVDTLQIAFGKWMQKHFAETQTGYFNAKSNAFDMLESVENEVHVEVRKLYPDAELPHFTRERPQPGTFVFTYHSPRRLVAFCQGLIEGCIEHYGETVSVSCEQGIGDDTNTARFTLVREVQ